jgi:hypothetical protein
MQIPLTKEEYRYISAKFTICVCNGCLNELKEEYNAKFHHNKPNNMIKRNFSFFIFFLSSVLIKALAQTYAPAAGQPGSSAIYKDSSVFVAWATGCKITRGYQDVSNQSLGFASVGDSSMASGKAQSNGVVSLGDGGVAICTFANPVRNGNGFDFAVFENSIDDSFLELAFIEVSSDGVNYFRFPARSLTDTTTQTGSFGSTDPTNINNLAGKYRAGYGTPFDLQELSGKPGLNINAITHVKIIDVVGSINNTYATRDNFNSKVNDPWPTGFPSGGFDLDAVGVIYENTVAGLKETEQNHLLSLFPNPCPVGSRVKLKSDQEIISLEMLDVNGDRVMHTDSQEINLEGLAQGVYVLKILTSKGLTSMRLLIF